MSVAIDRNGSHLLIGEASTGYPVLKAPRPFAETRKATLKSTGYWATWVGFGALALRCDPFYVMNGWWMVLLYFWFTASEVTPAHAVSGGFKWLATGAATVAAAFLICETFNWLEHILEGWSWGPPGQRLRVVAIPIQVIVGAMLTAVVLGPQLRRHFGSYTVPLLLVVGLSPGIADFGTGLVSATHWREHWLGSCIGLFSVAILPLVLAASSERFARLPRPNGRIAAAVARLWRGEIPTWVVLSIVYPTTIVGVFWLEKQYDDLPNRGYSDWKYANLRATAWVLLILLLIVGSTVTWRCLNRSVAKGSRIARWVQGIIFLVAARFLLITLLGVGFEVGHFINTSTRTALGSAYYLQVPDHGVELHFSGDVTYGLTDRLTTALDANPGVSRIRLESGGGSSNEALSAAKVIAARKLDTIVSGECASACTYLFLAGKKRTLEKGGQLGFHSAINPDPSKDATGFIRDTLSPFVRDKRFIARAEATDHSTMWYPTREELVKAGVLTVAPP